MQTSIDNAVVAFYSHAKDAFPVILKSMIEAVKGDEAPGTALRKAFETILEVVGSDDEVDEKVLGNMALLNADGIIEDVVDAILSEQNKTKLKVWLGGLLKKCCYK